jgi:predicted metal-dependent enzyme (double-stranded beta helix superfamily)
MLTTTRPGLDQLTSAIRAEARPGRGARDTALAVADLLRRRTPALDLLTDDELAGDGAGFARHVLHAEPAFSVVAVVWRPGQRTPIHDHIAWCSFVVLQGVEYETLYRDHGDHLGEIGRVANRVGDASGFAPPGDIHRVHNTGDITAVSLHVYGADLGTDPSSVRRTYDLPVR